MNHSLPFAVCTPNAANSNMADVTAPEDIAAMERAISSHVAGILNILCIADSDPNVRDTPRRYAKMLVREVCRGRYEPAPSITTFPNTGNLNELIVTGPITVRSMCSHHFCPILGKCWIGIIPGERLAGVSKFDRVVDWFAARPQIQEELVVQIADFLEAQLAPIGVAVVIRATHTCMTWRGVRADPESLMTTNVVRGAFRDKPEARAEFLRFIPSV